MKPTAMILISSLLFQILAPGVCYSSGQLQVHRTERVSGPVAAPPSTGGRSIKEESKKHSVRGSLFHREPTRVRAEAPLISKEPIIGRFICATQDTLIVLSERGLKQRMPLSSIENFEVSIKRSRNTAKGMLIGIVLTGAYFIPGVFLDEAKILDHRSTSAAIFLSSTVIGLVTRSDEWMEVSPYRLKPSAAITQDRGLGAAVSFDF